MKRSYSVILLVGETIRSRITGPRHGAAALVAIWNHTTEPRRGAAALVAIWNHTLEPRHGAATWNHTTEPHNGTGKHIV